MTRLSCPYCKGTGLADTTATTKSRECRMCNGSGFEASPVTVDWTVQAVKITRLNTPKPKSQPHITDWARVYLMASAAPVAIMALWNPAWLAFAIAIMVAAYLPSKASP